MNFRAAALSAFLILAFSTLATAGPIVDAAQRAEMLQAEGKTVEALDALDAAVDVIWSESPLAFREVALVESGGGAAAERTDRTFQADETLTVRVEPVGYGYGASGSGARIGFTGDLALENATGQVLTEASDLFAVSVESERDRREFDMTLSFVVPYIRPGDYVARFTLRDQNSDKTGSFDVPFTVAAPANGGDPPPAAGAVTGGAAAGGGATPPQ